MRRQERACHGVTQVPLQLSGVGGDDTLNARDALGRTASPHGLHSTGPGLGPPAPRVGGAPDSSAVVISAGGTCRAPEGRAGTAWQAAAGLPMPMPLAAMADGSLAAASGKVGGAIGGAVL